ncbi:MAG: hypothetical protein JST92_20865 [Deltaproteobacteria bacterium]|nr:hypothetical protein [Deltaproteobacteria bacterium]
MNRTMRAISGAMLTLVCACATAQGTGTGTGAQTPSPTPAPTQTPAPTPTQTPTPTPAPTPTQSPIDPLGTDEVLQTGGDLDLRSLPQATVETKGDLLIAYGQTEVPGDSRLQAALALADAVARAELLAAVRTGLATLTIDTQEKSGDSEKQRVEVFTAQVAKGLLPALPLPKRGWQKVKRDGKVILRLWSRIEAPREAVQHAVAVALDTVDSAKRAAEAVARMRTEKSLATPSK